MQGGNAPEPRESDAEPCGEARVERVSGQLTMVIHRFFFTRKREEPKMQMAKFQKVQYLIITAVASLIFLVPVWSISLLPMGDLGHHLAVAKILQDYTNVQLYKESFFFTNWYSTNSTVYILFAGLFHIFSPETAARLVISIYVISLPLSFYFMLRSLGGPTWPAILSVAFLFNHSFNTGYVNFLLSIPLFFLGIGLHVGFFGSPSWRKGTACVGLLLLLFWTHVMTYGFLMLALLPLAFVTGKLSLKGMVAKIAAPASSAIPLFAWLIFSFSKRVEKFSGSSSFFSSLRPSYLDPRDLLGMLFSDSQRMIHSKIEGYIVFSIFFAILLAVIISILWGEKVTRPKWPPIIVFLVCLIGYLVCPLHFQFNWDIVPRFIPFVWLSSIALVQFELPKKGRYIIIGVFFVIIILNSAWLTRGFVRFQSQVEPIMKMARLIEPQTRIYRALYDTNDQSIFSNGGVNWHLDKYLMIWRTTLNNDILPSHPTCIVQFKEGKIPPSLNNNNFYNDPNLTYYDYIVTFKIPKDILERAKKSANLKMLLLKGRWGLFRVIKRKL
jgi:hypothetical protein